VANHRRQTGLDSIAANPPGLPHVRAPGPRCPRRSSPDPLGLWSRRQAPGTHHIFAQNHGVVLGDSLSLPSHVRKGFPRALGASYVDSGGCSQDLLSAPKRRPDAAFTYKQMALLVEIGILFIHVSTYNLCV